MEMADFDEYAEVKFRSSWSETGDAPQERGALLEMLMFYERLAPERQRLFYIETRTLGKMGHERIVELLEIADEHVRRGGSEAG